VADFDAVGALAVQVAGEDHGHGFTFAENPSHLSSQVGSKFQGQRNQPFAVPPGSPATLAY
jgi:hypothetical protein